MASHMNVEVKCHKANCQCLCIFLSSLSFPICYYQDVYTVCILWVLLLFYEYKELQELLIATNHSKFFSHK